MFKRFSLGNANNTAGSPARRKSIFSDVGTNTPPRSPLAALSNGQPSPGAPLTPRVTQHKSPTEFPSLSASRKFDWDAARQRKPPPYGSPLEGARAKAARKNEANSKTGQRRIVRRKGFIERITNFPSNIIHQISMFPSNIPFPESKTSAVVIGGFMHLVNLLVRLSHGRHVVEEEMPWSDVYGETKTNRWINWTTIFTILLICSSFFNTFQLLSHIRIYSLYHKTEPVNSPRACFVTTELDTDPLEAPSITYRVFSWLAYQFSISWRFLLNFKPPAPRVTEGANVTRFQQLHMWEPGEFELRLFSIYSPAHAFLWMVTTGSNWIIMFIIMGMVGLQTHMLISSFEGLIKDKAIIASEVMSEYNTKFVNPRVFPLREDKAVMTHQAEFIEFWNEY